MTYKMDNPNVKLIFTAKEQLINSPIWYAYVQSIPAYTFTASGALAALVGAHKRAKAEREAA